MPTPARPYPRDRGHETVAYHRRYLDQLNRPMTGKVTISRRDHYVAGDTVIPASSAPQELVDGHLNVRLAPGEYELVAQLRTRDNVGVVHKDVIAVQPPSRA
jgi:hypothetical protein